MKKRMAARAVLVLMVAAIAGGCAQQTEEEGPFLWPELEPYETGYLKVSDTHEIYYEFCGNPDGKPVFVLHGGPGAASYPYYRRFFDPESFHIVLHDQRGCGHSRPFLELDEAGGFGERFELSSDGDEYACLITNTFRRAE